MFIKNAKQSGVTLIELVVFMVIVSVALVGVLKVLDITNRGSVDPLVRKQALSIAESLLLEIEQQPFTLCDPDDANVSTATTAADCATTAQDPAPTVAGAITGPFPNTESRYSSTDPLTMWLIMADSPCREEAAQAFAALATPPRFRD